MIILKPLWHHATKVKVARYTVETLDKIINPTLKGYKLPDSVHQRSLKNKECLSSCTNLICVKASARQFDNQQITHVLSEKRTKISPHIQECKYSSTDLKIMTDDSVQN